MQEPIDKGVEKYQTRDISQLLKGYLTLWPLFLAAIIACVLAVWIYLRYATPVYQSTATMLIKDKGIEESKLLSSLDVYASNKIVENEIEILRSRTLAETVVKNLNLYALIYEAGAIHTVSAYVTSPVTVKLRNPDVLLQKQNIYFEYDKSKEQVVVENKTIPLNYWVNFEWGQIMFTQNKNFHSSNIPEKLYFNLLDVKEAADELLGRLQVTPISKISTVVSLKLKDEVKQRGEDILNELMQVYNSAAIADKSTLASNALSFVEDRLQFVVRDLDSVETELKLFKANKGVVDISEQGKLYLNSIEGTDKKISEIDIQLAVLTKIKGYLQTSGQAPAVTPSTVGLNDIVLAQLLNKLNEAEVQYDKLKRTTAENNATLTSIHDEIDKLKLTVTENVYNQTNNLEASKQNLLGTSSRYTSMLRTIPEKERELLDITRQQNIKNNIYTFLLQKREEAALYFASAVADSRIVDKAHTGKYPVSPNKPLLYSLALVMGLVLPAGIVWTKGLLSNTIQSKSDIEEVSSLPVVCLSNHEKKKSKDAAVRTQQMAEQFRQLRTTLLFLEEGKKRFLITSFVENEGKDFISYNLASSMAAMGKRVVLINLNQGKPGFDQFADPMVARGPGLNDYLRRTVNAEEIIIRTAENDNLFIVRNGTDVNNFSELLLNGKLVTFLNHLEEHYDYIIIDAAPISVSTDAYTISRYCDTALFVMKKGVTPRASLSVLDESMRLKGLKSGLIVFDDLRIDHLGKTGRYLFGSA